MAKNFVNYSAILTVIVLYMWHSNAKRLINTNVNLIATCNRLPNFLLKSTILRRCINTEVNVLTLYNASQLATRECQYQFRLRPWNCSSTPKSLSRITNHAFQETAYLFAIHTATLAYSLAQACSMGLKKDCICKESKRKMSKNSAAIIIDKQCSKQSMEYGITKSRYLLKNVREKDARSLVDEHNKEAGRQALIHGPRLHEDGMDCRCIGPSSTCTIKKCIIRLPNIRVVSSYLLKKYVAAINVGTDNHGKKLIPSAPTIVEPTKHDLVFTERSPNFCEKNLEKGSLGTKGRHCIKNAPIGSSSSCKILCCNRGYKTVTHVVKEHCNCAFQHCCFVKCDTCLRNVTTHICN